MSRNIAAREQKLRLEYWSILHAQWWSWLVGDVNGENLNRCVEGRKGDHGPWSQPDLCFNTDQYAGGGESSQLEGWKFDPGPGQLLRCGAICLPWWQYEGRQGVLSTGRLNMRPWTWSIAMLCATAICLPWWQCEGRRGELNTGRQIVWPWTWSTAAVWSSVPAIEAVCGY